MRPLFSSVFAASIAIAGLLADVSGAIASPVALGLVVGAEVVLLVLVAKRRLAVRLASVGLFLALYTAGTLLLPTFGAPPNIVFGLLALVYLVPLGFIGIFLPSLWRLLRRWNRKRR